LLAQEVEMKAYRALAMIVGLEIGFAAAAARSAVPFEPVRRDATLGFQGGDASVFGALTIPKATTRELAEYARSAGGAAAAKWFCSAYAGHSDDAPEAGTLHALIRRAAADGDAGKVAADSLVCPRVRRRARQRVEILNIGSCIVDECEHTWRRVVSHVLPIGLAKRPTRSGTRSMPRRARRSCAGTRGGRRRFACSANVRCERTRVSRSP
jgi:hypothetical protein